MTEEPARKRARRMADATVLSGRQMVARHTDGTVRAAVVTGGAGIADNIGAGVIDVGWYKHFGVMTTATIGYHGYMDSGLYWCIDGDIRVMTGFAAL